MMISPQTEILLTSLFSELAKGENLIEEMRIYLAQNPMFSPQSAFRQMDRYGLSFLSNEDIKSFLLKNSVDASDSQIYLLIRHYDKDSDGFLSEHEFLDLVNPHSLQYKSSSFQSADNLLVGLLSREKELQGKLEKIKQDIASIPGFNLLNAFRTIDPSTNGLIDYDSLSKFMRKNKSSFVSRDFEAVLRRIDRKGDQLIRYAEFIDFLLPGLPHTRGTPVKTRPSLSSFAKNRRLEDINQVCNRRFVSIIQKIVLVNKRLESDKAELAVQPDFNCSSLFNMIDLYRRKYLAPASLEEFFRTIHFECTPEDIYLIVKRYSREGKILYSDFSDMIEINRTPFDENSNKGLSEATLEYVRRLFVTLVQVEKEMGRVKQETKSFSLIEAFNELDLKARGYILKQDFEDLLLQAGSEVSGIQLDLLMQRFDRNRDDKVTYSEFFEEMNCN